VGAGLEATLRLGKCGYQVMLAGAGAVCCMTTIIPA